MVEKKSPAITKVLRQNHTEALEEMVMSRRLKEEVIPPPMSSASTMHLQTVSNLKR